MRSPLVLSLAAPTAMAQIDGVNKPGGGIG